MSKLPALALAGVAAAALAGTAVAAKSSTHVINVALPDGSTARVEYVGDVPPKVTVQPGPYMAAGDWAPLPAFAGFDRIFEDMNRQTEAMLRQAQEMARQPAANGGAAPYVASFGNAPAGVTSTSVVSYSNGSGTCTRTTQTVSQGAGKPPKVTSTLTGNCEGQAQTPKSSSAPVSNT